MKRLLDYDPFTGVTHYFHYDEQTGDWGIESQQDCSQIIEANKILQNEDSYSQKGIKNEWWHVASIPVVVQEKWLREGIDIFNKDHWHQVKRKLNDPEYRYLKATTGTV